MEDLKEYKDLFSDCHVTPNTEGYESLGIWVDHLWSPKNDFFLNEIHENFVLMPLILSGGYLKKGNDGL